MTRDDIEQKAKEWWGSEHDKSEYCEYERLAAFARSLVPLPLSMTEEEMEEESHKWANAEPPWEGPVERTYARTVFKDGLRYASTHTKTITVDEILELVKENDMDAEGDESFTNESHWANLHNRLTWSLPIGRALADGGKRMLGGVVLRIQVNRLHG